MVRFLFWRGRIFTVGRKTGGIDKKVTMMIKHFLVAPFKEKDI